MFSKRTGGWLFGVLLALVYMSMVAVAVPGLWQRIGTWLTAILLFLLGVGFCFVGVWVVVDRPAELQKKLPISSKQLRKQSKDFYDWLASQGRRQ